MMVWREAWWDRWMLVDRLEALGADHPLVARLEADGWEGLREDLEARQRLASAKGRPANWLDRLPLGVIARCRVCGGAGYSPDGEYECPECRGVGVVADRERDEAMADAPVPTRWGRVYRVLRDVLGREHAEKAAWRGFLQKDPELPF